MYTGDIETKWYDDTSDAMRWCNTLPNCKSFISGVATANGKRNYYMKNGFNFPIQHNDLTLFIKKDYLEDYLTGSLTITIIIVIISTLFFDLSNSKIWNYSPPPLNTAVKRTANVCRLNGTICKAALFALVNKVFFVDYKKVTKYIRFIFSLGISLGKFP